MPASRLYLHNSTTFFQGLMKNFFRRVTFRQLLQSFHRSLRSAVVWPAALAIAMRLNFDFPLRIIKEVLDQGQAMLLSVPI